MRPPAPRRRSGAAGARDAAAFPDASRATASMREPNDRRRRPRRSLRPPFRDSRRRCARRSRSGGGPVVQCPNGAISRQHSTFRAACIHAAQTLSDTYRSCRCGACSPNCRETGIPHGCWRSARDAGPPAQRLRDGARRRLPAPPPELADDRFSTHRFAGASGGDDATGPPADRPRPAFPDCSHLEVRIGASAPSRTIAGTVRETSPSGSGRAAAMRFPSHLGHRIRTVAGRHRDPASAMPEAVQRPNEDRCRTGRGGRSATVAPAREPARMPPHATSRRDARPADLPAC
jgi:hypothetical protein